MNRSIQVFDKLALKYDRWFEENRAAYEAEVSAIKSLLPPRGAGLEIGVGTGRFAVPFNIKVGVEPAKAMADIARKRGITVYEALAEDLPFEDELFDFVLLVTVICFLKNPVVVLKEARRVLKPGGKMVIGMLDRESPLGKIYDLRKSEDDFYREAHFYSSAEVLKWLEKLKFDHIDARQTIFALSDSEPEVQPVREGTGEGLFVAVAARKR